MKTPARSCIVPGPSRADHPEGPVARWDVYELIAFGRIRLRRIDGYQHLYAIINQQEELAA